MPTLKYSNSFLFVSRSLTHPGIPSLPGGLLVSVLYYVQKDLNMGPETIYPATPGSGKKRKVIPPSPTAGVSLTKRIRDFFHMLSTDDGLFCLKRQILRWVGLVATLGSGCAMALTGEWYAVVTVYCAVLCCIVLWYAEPYCTAQNHAVMFYTFGAVLCCALLWAISLLPQCALLDDDWCECDVHQ
jgi:hypothetical protein